MTISQSHTKEVAQILSMSLLPSSQLKWCFKPTGKALPTNHLDITYYPIFKYSIFGLITNSDSVALRVINM